MIYRDSLFAELSVELSMSWISGKFRGIFLCILTTFSAGREDASNHIIIAKRIRRKRLSVTILRLLLLLLKRRALAKYQRV